MDWVGKAENMDLVFHCELFICGQRFILNDSTDTRVNTTDHAMSIVVTFDSVDELKAAYSILSQGCAVVNPMKSASYCDCIVSLIDRFGIRWELIA